MSDGKKMNGVAGRSKELDEGEDVIEHDEAEVEQEVKIQNDQQGQEENEKHLREIFEEHEKYEHDEGSKQDKEERNRGQYFEPKMQEERGTSAREKKLEEQESKINQYLLAEHMHKDENGPMLSWKKEKPEEIEKQDYEEQEKHMNMAYGEEEIKGKQHQEEGVDKKKTEARDLEKQTGEEKQISESEQAEGQDLNQNGEKFDQGKPEEKSSDDRSSKLIMGDIDLETLPAVALENVIQNNEGILTSEDIYLMRELAILEEHHQQLEREFSQGVMSRQLLLEQLVRQEMELQNTLQEILASFDEVDADDDSVSEGHPPEDDSNAS